MPYSNTKAVQCRNTLSGTLPHIRVVSLYTTDQHVVQELDPDGTYGQPYYYRNLAWCDNENDAIRIAQALRATNER